MRTDRKATELEQRAAVALKALLGQISAVNIHELKSAPRAHGDCVEIMASLDVYGHKHTLACAVHADASPGKIRASLGRLQELAAHQAGQTTPVLIAPYLSPEAQALCKENHAGFLDLEGNARLNMGEVFIGKRSLHNDSSDERAA